MEQGFEHIFTMLPIAKGEDNRNMRAQSVRVLREAMKEECVNIILQTGINIDPILSLLQMCIENFQTTLLQGILIMNV
jgi:hypothetical protein